MNQAAAYRYVSDNLLSVDEYVCLGSILRVMPSCILLQEDREIEIFLAAKRQTLDPILWAYFSKF